MKVKDRYNHLSEQLMYEWSLETPTVFNRNKIMSFAYFQSVKELEVDVLLLADILRLSKIEETQMKELKPKRFR